MMKCLLGSFIRCCWKTLAAQLKKLATSICPIFSKSFTNDLYKPNWRSGREFHSLAPDLFVKAHTLDLKRASESLTHFFSEPTCRLCCAWIIHPAGRFNTAAGRGTRAHRQLRPCERNQ